MELYAVLPRTCVTGKEFIFRPNNDPSLTVNVANAHLYRERTQQNTISPRLVSLEHGPKHYWSSVESSGQRIDPKAANIQRRVLNILQEAWRGRGTHIYESLYYAEEQRWPYQILSCKLVRIVQNCIYMYICSFH